MTRAIKSIWNSTGHRRKKCLTVVILLGVFLSLLIPFMTNYKQEVEAANLYRLQQKAEHSYLSKLRQDKTEILRCLSASTSDDCVPQLAHLFNLIKVGSGQDQGELDWWFQATMWQASNVVVNNEAHWIIVRRAWVYGFIDSAEPYTPQNDPTRQKFQTTLREKLKRVAPDA
ncbi:hypothetical protein ACQ4M3_09770 [Leptolyngbya sp. AN03gr2]|uniref:hypothetical protein n=1 Tax=Leptolyngbya sp. AN03gr2 TaxID=3423364 RepID=UPI003D319DCE